MKLARIRPSRPGRVMVEFTAAGVVVDRRYTRTHLADRYRREGWTVWVPAAGEGWKRE